MARPKNGNFNEVTGAGLVTKPANDDYRNGWDRIFGNKEKEPEVKKELTEEETSV